MAEKFFSILKTECIHMEKPKTISDARELTEQFINYYNYNKLFKKIARAQIKNRLPKQSTVAQTKGDGLIKCVLILS